MFWAGELKKGELPDDSKSVSLREVLEIRRGTDPDPDRPGMHTTEVFRRSALKPYELENSFSLILRDRCVEMP